MFCCASLHEEGSFSTLTVLVWHSWPLAGLLNFHDVHSYLHHDVALYKSMEKTVRGSSLQPAAGLRPSFQLPAQGHDSQPC